MGQVVPLAALDRGRLARRGALPRPVSWLALGLGVLVASLASAAGDDLREAWLPLELGAEHVYRAHWDYSFQPAAGSAVRRFSLGQIRERVLAEGPSSPEAGASIYRLRREIEEKSMETGTTQNKAEDYFMVSGNRGAFGYFPRGAPGAAGSWPAFHDSPVRLLPPDPRKGQQWPAGVLHDEGMRVELRGEILGFEDLAFAEREFENCLHLRLLGTPRGSLTGSKQPVRIAGGAFLYDIWLSRGVGIVQAVARTDLDLVASDGAKLKSSSVSTRTLSSLGPD